MFIHMHTLFLDVSYTVIQMPRSQHPQHPALQAACSLGFRLSVKGSGFRVQVLGFRLQGLGFRV